MAIHYKCHVPDSRTGPSLCKSFGKQWDDNPWCMQDCERLCGGEGDDHFIEFYDNSGGWGGSYTIIELCDLFTGWRILPGYLLTGEDNYVTTSSEKNEQNEKAEATEEG